MSCVAVYLLPVTKSAIYIGFEILDFKLSAASHQIAFHIANMVFMCMSLENNNFRASRDHDALYNKYVIVMLSLAATRMQYLVSTVKKKQCDTMLRMR